jgi:tetratricopeptide (TPR) repeat protein
MNRRVCLVVAAVFCVGSADAQSLQKAEMLLENGLVPDAQKELIEVISSTSSALAPDRPKALSLLATIAVRRDNFRAAEGAWNRLIRDYPKSAEAALARERMPLLASVMGKAAEEELVDAAMGVYIRNGDFWAEGRDKIFHIDTSWIGHVEAAISWYDRVIAESPGSTAARLAYEYKMRTLVGWEEPGRDGKSYGARGNPTKYVPQLVETFRNYEKVFPSAFNAQAFRFQIAQAFWVTRNWDQARAWLNEIVDKDNGANSFYKDLAQRRLQKVEY